MPRGLGAKFLQSRLDGLCVLCHEQKDLQASYRCASCLRISKERQRANRRAWYVRNQETEKAKALVAYYLDRPAALERNRRWMALNAESRRLQRQEWTKAPETRLLRRYHEAKRRAMLAGVKSDVTPGQERKLLSESDGICFYCDSRTDRMTLDHVVALSNGGNHTRANLVACCKSCNSRKHTKHVLDYLALILPELGIA